MRTWEKKGGQGKKNTFPRIKYDLTMERAGGCGALRVQSKIFSGKMPGRRCDGFWQSLWGCGACWLLFSPGTGVSLPWLMTFWEGHLWQLRSPGGSVFRQIRGVQGEPLLPFAVNQVAAAQNNQNTKVAYFRVPCPELSQSHLGGIFYYPLFIDSKPNKATSPVASIAHHMHPIVQCSDRTLKG